MWGAGGVRVDFQLREIRLIASNLKSQQFNFSGGRRSARIILLYLESKGNVTRLVEAPHRSCMYGSDYVIPGCQDVSDLFWGEATVYLCERSGKYAAATFKCLSL